MDDAAAAARAFRRGRASAQAKPKPG